MKTQGEIEAAVCVGMTAIEQQYIGRGPKDIHAHLIGDFLVVRLHGVLTEGEQQLVKTMPPREGAGPAQASRTQIIEMARPVLEAMTLEATGVQVLSTHHDISTLTGEEVVHFTLTARPQVREAKKR